MTSTLARLMLLSKIKTIILSKISERWQEKTLEKTTSGSLDGLIHSLQPGMVLVMMVTVISFQEVTTWTHATWENATTTTLVSTAISTLTKWEQANGDATPMKSAGLIGMSDNEEL